MEESTLIEQSKFAVGAEPPAIDAGELDWGYGENRITAMVLDPDSAYLYWEVTDEGIADARARLGPGGRDAWCNLRVYDTTDRAFDGTNANDYIDIQVDRRDRDYFVRVRRPGSSMHAEIGMRSHEGFFQPIARSGRADFPRTQPSSDSRLEWMNVTGDSLPPCVAPYKSRFSGPEPRLPLRGEESYTDVWRAGPATPTPYQNHVIRHSIPGSMWATHRTVGHYGIEHVERWWRIDEWRAEWRSGLRFFRWERLDPQRVVVELLGERPQDVAIEGGGMVVYGPWRVTIRGVEQDSGRRVLATWSMRWVRATTPMIERWGIRRAPGPVRLRARTRHPGRLRAAAPGGGRRERAVAPRRVGANVARRERMDCRGGLGDALARCERMVRGGGVGDAVARCERPSLARRERAHVDQPGPGCQRAHGEGRVAGRQRNTGFEPGAGSQPTRRGERPARRSRRRALGGEIGDDHAARLPRDGPARAPAVRAPPRGSLVHGGGVVLRGRSPRRTSRCCWRSSVSCQTTSTFASRSRFSPSLLAMLTDDLLKERYADKLDKLIELGRKRGRPDRARGPRPSTSSPRCTAIASARCATAGAATTAIWCSGFRALQDAGQLEIITCTATHPFFPLLDRNWAAFRAQVHTAADLYERLFGRRPQGMWLGECGYVPGVDELLREEGIRYFFVDTHGVLFADPRPLYGVYAPIYCRSGVAAFGRDIESSKQVWSAQEGYPGDPALPRLLPRHRLRPADRLHRAVHPPGRASGSSPASSTTRSPTARSHDKRPYDPHLAYARAAEHAGNFMFNREQQVEHLRANMDRRPSWWRPTTPSSSVTGGTRGRCSWSSSSASCSSTRAPSRPSRRAATCTSTPPTRWPRRRSSSWGEKGYADYWCNGTNAWVYRHLHKMAERMVELARRFPDAQGAAATRALNQAARELMLAQSSDWAFIMRTGTTVPYATKRTNDHVSASPASTRAWWRGRDRRRMARRGGAPGQPLPRRRLPRLRRVRRGAGHSLPSR